MGVAGVLVPLRPRAVTVAAPLPAESPAWSLPLVAVAGALWGQGLVAPFDEGRAQALIDALDVSASDRVLLVGAGPGGAERLLSNLSGAEIMAFEADPLLALLGGARSFNPRQPDFGRHGHDLAIVLDVPPACRAEDLLAAVAFALRPDGRMVVDASLSDPDRVAHALRHLRCTVEAAEDRSQPQVHQVIAGWTRLAGLLGRKTGGCPLPAEGRRAVMNEAERWMPRVGRLRQGTMRHVRLLARGRGMRGAA